MTRARIVLAALAIALAAVLAISADAARQRATERSADAIVSLTGLPDLALSSSVRWLRHPSQSEPGAAASDVVHGLDVDPAGGMIGPPRAIYLEVDAIEIHRRP
jgi:hypothetical protein